MTVFSGVPPAYSRAYMHYFIDQPLGDLLIHGLWSCSTDCILDVCITNTDAKTYLSKDPRKVLASHEKKTKKLTDLSVIAKSTSVKKTHTCS